MKQDVIKKILIGVTAFFLYVLMMTNYVHATSLFLSKLGPGGLPFALIISASLVLLFSFLSSIISIKYAPHHIFLGMMIFLFVNFFILSFIDSNTSFHVFYFMVLTGILSNVQEILMLNFANSMLTPLQAKRFLPSVVSFMSLGAIVGALIAVPYQKLHEYVGIGYIPMIGYFLFILLIIFTSTVFKKDIYTHFTPQSLKTYKDDFKSSLKIIFNSTNLYKLVGLIVILGAGIHVMMEFKLKTILSFEYGNSQLTEMLSFVYMLNRVAVLVMTTFFAKRLLFRFGVTNMIISFPLAVFLSLGVSFLLGFNISAFIVAYIIYSVFELSFFGICTSQILSIAPKKNHQSIYYLIRGILTSFTFVVFSLILLIYSYKIELETFVNTIMIFIACGLMIYVGLKVKKSYEKNLTDNLYQEDEYLMLKSIDLLAEKISKDRGEKDLRKLLDIPGISNDVRSRVMASIGVIGNYQTIMDLAKILLSSARPKVKIEAIYSIDNIIKRQKDFNKYPVTKHFLLKAYEKILLSDQPQFLKLAVIDGLKHFDLGDVIDFLEKNLRSDSVNIKSNTIKTLATFDDRGIIPFIEPFLEARNLQLRASAIVSLWKFEEMRESLKEMLSILLSMKSDGAVENMLYVIGAIKEAEYKDYALKHIDNNTPHIRTLALLTLIKLGESSRIDDLIRKLLSLAKYDDRTEIEFILSHYRYFDESIKKTIIRKIQEMTEDEATYFYNAFKQSHYVFNWEESQLNRGRIICA